MTAASQLIDVRREREAARLGPVPRRDVTLLTNGVFPVLRSLIRAGYLSLSVEGVHHIPRSGSAIYVGNHAGWFTLDTLLGALAVADHAGVDRLPWGAVQDQLLEVPTVGRFFEGIGGFPASWLRRPRGIPAEMQVFSIYPEGTEGNCKSFMHAYQMRPWHTGFVRVAAERAATIVPVAIVGGEECLPVVSTIRFLKPLIGTILPLPLVMFPLPSSWKFIFLEPVRLNQREFAAQTNELSRRSYASEIAAKIRERVQLTIDEETSRHKLVRFTRFIKNPLDATVWRMARHWLGGDGFAPVRHPSLSPRADPLWSKGLTAHAGARDGLRKPVTHREEEVSI
jgi:1-acyl-sn-glycerol-3-phosphate acyltransferase